MSVDINTYRVRVGLFCFRHWKIKILKHFSNFEFVLFISMLLLKSGDIESNPGPDVSFDSSDSSVASSDNEPLSRTFDQYFSVVYYNVQSLLTKLDKTESELSIR